jgi:hypothetical protein
MTLSFFICCTVRRDLVSYCSHWYTAETLVEALSIRVKLNTQSQNPVLQKFNIQRTHWKEDRRRLKLLVKGKKKKKGKAIP